MLILRVSLLFEENAALVMAAGFSKRFGQDKRLHPIKSFNNLDLLSLTLKNTLQHYDKVAVVLRNSDKNDPISQRLSLLPVKIIFAPKEPIGLGESISCAIKALRHFKCSATSALRLLMFVFKMLRYGSECY